MSPVHRRAWLTGALTSAAGLALGGCDRLTSDPRVNSALEAGEIITRQAQRGLVGRTALAREYPASAISADFRANGTTNPDNEVYQQHLAQGFEDWRLEIGGLVDRPLSLSLAELRGAPSRTQITRHDCVEGWSSIGKWRGALLGPLLDRAGLKPEARFIAFFCADTLELTFDGSGDYYETIDVMDAYHPQTLLAYEMNDRPLPVAHGAPVRLRLERQLGYKMAKYVMRVEAIRSFADLGRGQGGYWEDRGYQWYAGI
ncbi:MAG: molybdopterin-dependent oxidoreductase [Phenylobacterium sp.]|uniref:molybdopterin-dependent oxidoreductase n=1 Tax=Phenylobacterium sp. TaxID=1871053 RepID=UPI0027325BD3|nr:molybdopterin-dependent oxidoreductase [Phenylobacterium sp.]MDP3747089.1 molybdopterin-dependent oxidoreductase [Phenylobacterium sp.]